MRRNDLESDVAHSLHLFFLVPLVQLRVVMPCVLAPLVAHAALYAVELCWLLVLPLSLLNYF